jgi:hypothetical protein
MDVNADNCIKMAGNNIYRLMVKWWLVGILIILPFQINIATLVAKKSIKLSSLIHNLDELTIIVFLLLAIREHYKNRRVFVRSFFFY